MIMIDNSKQQALDSLIEKVQEMLGGSAESKGYHDLYKILGKDHSTGELICKAFRYKFKENPEDLVKLVGWAVLLYREYHVDQWHRKLKEGKLPVESNVKAVGDIDAYSLS